MVRLEESTPQGEGNRSRESASKAEALDLSTEPLHHPLLGVVAVTIFGLTIAGFGVCARIFLQTPGDITAASEHIASTAIYAALLMNSLLEGSTCLTSTPAFYTLIESAVYLATAGSFALRALGHDRVIDPAEQDVTMLLLSSWLLALPCISALLWLVSRVPWRIFALNVTSMETLMLCRWVGLATTDPSVAAALRAIRVAAMIVALSTIAYMLARIAASFASTRHGSKAWVLAIAGLAVVATASAHTVLQLQLERDGLWLARSRVLGVMIDGTCRALLVRCLMVSNATRIAVRQMQVMRAIESGASGKSAADLRAATHQRDAFLAAVSHELRTPLNGIIGLTEGLLKQTCGPITDTMRRQLHVIRMSGLRLLNMINGVLDSSAARIECLNIRQDVVALRETVADVMALTRHVLKPGVSLGNEVPAACTVRGDADRIVQVLNNLLGNAAKFTARGTVRVSASPRGTSWWAIAVSDSGTGISENKLRAIFQAFEQVDTSIPQLHDGFGLGLHIARDLVRAHGGIISVASTLERGSTFTFTLPNANTCALTADAVHSGASLAGRNQDDGSRDNQQHMARTGSVHTGAYASSMALPRFAARGVAFSGQSTAAASFATGAQALDASHLRQRHASAPVTTLLGPRDNTGPCQVHQGTTAQWRTAAGPLASLAPRDCTSSYSGASPSNGGAVPEVPYVAAHKADAANAGAQHNVLRGASIVQQAGQQRWQRTSAAASQCSMLSGRAAHALSAAQLQSSTSHVLVPEHGSQQRLQDWLQQEQLQPHSLPWAARSRMQQAWRHDGRSELSVRQQQSIERAGRTGAVQGAARGSICDRFRHCVFPQLAQSAPSVGWQRDSSSFATSRGAHGSVLYQSHGGSQLSGARAAMSAPSAQTHLHEPKLASPADDYI